MGVNLRVTLADSPPDAPPLLDTKAPGGRALAFVYLAPRRPGGALCPGLELGLGGMRRGGRRVVDVPPALGPYAGAAGPPLAPGGAPLPANAALRYEVWLEEVSPAYM